jgi:hypothetical protein
MMGRFPERWSLSARCDVVHTRSLSAALLPLADIHLQELTMPTSMKELDRTYRRTYRRIMTGVFVVYGVSLLMVLSLLVSNPKISTWISEAAHSEFVSTEAPAAPAPLRLAEPARPTQTAKAE